MSNFLLSFCEKWWLLGTLRLCLKSQEGCCNHRTLVSRAQMTVPKVVRRAAETSGSCSGCAGVPPAASTRDRDQWTLAPAFKCP